MSIASKLRQVMTQVAGRRGELLSVERLSPRLLRLRVQSPALVGHALRPGDKVKLEVGGGLLRSYTPSAIDPETGEMAMVVHLHGPSAAVDWAQALAPGAEICFLGPASSVASPPAALPWAAFFGDETTIGLAEAIAAALPEGTPFFGAIEVDAEDRSALESSPLRALARQPERGRALVEHLAALSLPASEGGVWISGEAASVLALRAALIERGLRREQLRIKPYWSLRGKAERKRIEAMMR